MYRCNLWKMIMVCLFSVPVQAAEFEVEKATTQTPYGVSIVVKMTGPILEGDKERLEAAIQSVDWEINWRQKTLQMNSDGGSLAAGIDLGKYINESGFQTYVGAEDSCLSACAIAFMHGSQLEGDGFRETVRTMHHQAVLGFHAPYAFSKNEKIPDKVRETLLPLAERGARQAGSDLVRLSVAGLMPSDLIQELLIVEQEDFLLVDTVDRAARWGIQIENAEVLQTLSHDRLNSYCSNIMAWENSVSYEKRGPHSDVVLMAMEDGFGTAMMDFDCLIELKEFSDESQPVAVEENRGAILAWKAMPGNTLLSTMGPEEIVGANGPRWSERFPLSNSIGNIDFSAIRQVSGRCKDGLVWLGGWYGKDGSTDYADFAQSHATVGTCGGGFGPMSIECRRTDTDLLVRFAYGRSQQPNADGSVFLDLDGEVYVLEGRNDDVYGHEQVYVNLAMDHPILDRLKGGSLLKLIGDGPNQNIHLSGSRQAIEAMELSCR